MALARFPFSAVVGHDDLRLALLLNAVHPTIGGVLVRGEKGTAKSTIVRALAALGRAQVERGSVSVSHAASFLLVGTMNPEEGELRPQLLDRFGLTVQVAAAREVSVRTEVIRRRLAFEADPAGFAARWAAADQELAERIATASAALPGVALPDAELRRIATVCAAVEVDGMRVDLVVARTALADAAWRGAD